MLESNQKRELVLLEDLGMMYATSNSSQKSKFGLYKCYCGNEFKARVADIKNNNTKSCGCYNKEVLSKRVKTHGLSNHPLKSVWNSLIQRCTNSNNKRFYNYGGRGITVCDEWRNDFMSFYNWALQNGYKDGLSVDRINNDKGYSPENCRFTNRNIQSRNTRIIMSTNKSGYRGVSFKKKNKKFQVQISVYNKNIYIGLFDNEIEAAKAYNDYVIKNNLEHTLNKV